MQVPLFVQKLNGKLMLSYLKEKFYGNPLKNTQLKFYGQFEVPVDKFLYERYFVNFKYPGVFVECGAFDGLIECSCKFFEETLNWRGVNIEPVLSIYEKLCINRPNSINLNYALSNKNGSEQFATVIHPAFGEFYGNGSLHHMSAHRDVLNQMNCKFQEITVECITYDKLLDLTQLKQIDLLVLDIEGHELEVLTNMLSVKRVLPKVLCVEYGHLGLLEMCNLAAKMDYHLNALSYVNAIFVKNEYCDQFPVATHESKAIDKLVSQINTL